MSGYSCSKCNGRCDVHQFALYEFAIICQECGNRTVKYSSEAEAIAAWNRRATSDEDKPPLKLKAPGWLEGYPTGAYDYDLFVLENEVDRLMKENDALVRAIKNMIGASCVICDRQSCEDGCKDQRMFKLAKRYYKDGVE